MDMNDAAKSLGEYGRAATDQAAGVLATPWETAASALAVAINEHDTALAQLRDHVSPFYVDRIEAVPRDSESEDAPLRSPAVAFVTEQTARLRNLTKRVLETTHSLDT